MNVVKLVDWEEQQGSSQYENEKIKRFQNDFTIF